MRKIMFALLALTVSLFGTQCWAQGPVCVTNEGGGVTCPFNPTTVTNTYFFGDNSQLTVHFDIVLTTFTLTVTVSHPTNPLPLDPNEFPTGTVCVQYPSNATNTCDQYDFTGSAGGPNGVPVRNTDYKGLITLTLSYFTSQTVHNPAFGHAPGDITTFTEDILTSYSVLSPTSDPTMDGSTPGLSSVVALDEPFVESGDSFCSLTLQTAPFHVGQQIEVDYRLTNSADCSTGIRDKTARFSLSTRDSNLNVVFPALTDKEEANKFHWDNKNKLNEFDLSTVGLAPGNYTITVFSSKISPQSISFVLAP